MHYLAIGASYLSLLPPPKKQASRRLVRSLLTICDIGVSLHPWPMCLTELRITRYSAACAKFERRTKLVISKLQCNTALIESG